MTDPVTVTVTSACYWTASDGWQMHLLQIPSGNTSFTTGVCMSDDGSVIVGTSVTSVDSVTSSTSYCVFTNGSLTRNLAPLTVLGGAAFPQWCSSDASVIVGTIGAAGGYWTDGGATANALPVIAGGVSTYLQTSTWFNGTSLDGTVFYGDCLATGGVFWVSGSPVLASTDAEAIFFTTKDTAGGSGDGSTMTVQAPKGSGEATTLGFIRLSDHTYRQLTNVGVPSPGGPIIRGITNDASVIWATTTLDGHLYLFYWNDLDFINTDGNHGVVNAVTTVMEFPGLAEIARDATSPPICVSVGVFGDTNVYKVAGTTASILPTLAGFDQSFVSGCSGNGDVICGSSQLNSSPFTGVPVRWDASLSVFELSALSGWTAATAQAVSRDGGVILGTANTTVTYTPPTPPAPPGPPTLVKLYPSAPTDGDFFVIDTASGGLNAEFPDTFGQFSISVWCCKEVTLRWPDVTISTTPFGLLQMSPTSVIAAFRDASQVLLFSGTFTNPGTAVDLYNICFSIDTEAQTVTCFGNGVAWASSGITWGSVGDIGNVPNA